MTVPLLESGSLLPGPSRLPTPRGPLNRPAWRARSAPRTSTPSFPCRARNSLHFMPPFYHPFRHVFSTVVGLSPGGVRRSAGEFKVENLRPRPSH